MTVQAVSSILLRLELAGAVERAPRHLRPRTLKPFASTMRPAVSTGPARAVLTSRSPSAGTRIRIPMKQTVIDILIYLFEHYIDDEIEIDADRDRLKAELRNAGFEGGQVSKAFDWLQELAVNRASADDLPSAAPTSTRVYTSDEQAKLDTECRGFLVFLEQANVLDAISRELVVDRVLALESDEIDIVQLKWIILMVLFNQPGQEQAFLWMEDLVMDDLYGYLH